MRLTAALPLLVVVLLAGCAPSGPTAAPESQPGATPTEVTTPAPTPTETLPPPVATCENLLIPAHLDGLTANGLTVNPTPEYTEKITGYDSQFSHFIAYGGVMCPVSNGYSVEWLYGYSRLAPDEQAVEVSRLLAEGWLASERDGGTLYTDPSEAAEGIVFHYFFRDGAWWCADSIEHIAEIVANSP